MRVAYWAGVILIAMLVAAFAISNLQPVSLKLEPLPFVADAPLYLVVLVSLVFGFLIGAVAAWIRGRTRRLQLRNCRRQNEALARELASTQAQLAGTSPKPRAV